MTVNDFVAASPCPPSLRPRLASRLRDAFGEDFPDEQKRVAAQIERVLFIDVHNESIRVASALGVAPSPSPVGYLLAGLREPRARTVAAPGEPAGAPHCPRCGRLMTSGVKIYSNIPVFYCLADRVVELVG